MAPRKTDAERLREKTGKAALLAVERLEELLRDPEASRGDILKAAALIFEKIHPQTAGGGAAAGDFEICIKEE